MSKERAAEPIIRGCRSAIRRGAFDAVDLVERLEDERARPIFLMQNYDPGAEGWGWWKVVFTDEEFVTDGVRSLEIKR